MARAAVLDVVADGAVGVAVLLAGWPCCWTAPPNPGRQDRGDRATVGRAGRRRLPGVLRRSSAARIPNRGPHRLVSYASYFDTLRTDVAGGGADDIFWINNSYFAEYADNGRLMEDHPRCGRTGSRRWSASSPAAVDYGGFRN